MCHATSMQMKERGVSHPGPHSPDHPCTAYKITESAEPVHSGPLKDVMADAVERWFVDTLRNAKNGDANQAALLAEMLSTGYGCTKDGGKIIVPVCGLKSGKCSTSYPSGCSSSQYQMPSPSCTGCCWCR